ncbi:MAG: DUF5666 domain-containing protein [bacterium]
MMQRRKGLLVFLLGGLVAAISVGCSSESPLAPISSPITQEARDGSGDPSLSAGNIQFDSRVATIDLAERKLTFTGASYVAIAAEDCEIVRLDGGTVTPILFSDIQVGDSARVCGILQSDSEVLANKIRIFAESECPDYDVAFRDTIATIDYAAGSFTVTGRSEVILVDDNTVIWGHTSQALSGGGGNGGEGNVVKGMRIYYEFTDLAVGHVVEVRADIVSLDTLLAVSIKVANCSFKKSVEFSAYLASVDVPARIVTFDGLPWIAMVCPQAALIDLDGQPLTLADFASGDFVAVKGFPLEADSLFVCLMEKIEP